MFAKWLKARVEPDGGAFALVGRALVAKPGNGIGLLYYGPEQFDNFALRLDFACRTRAETAMTIPGFAAFRDANRKPLVLPGTPGLMCPATLPLWRSIPATKSRSTKKRGRHA